jgi:hypothetical protein
MYLVGWTRSLELEVIPEGEVYRIHKNQANDTSLNNILFKAYSDWVKFVWYNLKVFFL